MTSQRHEEVARHAGDLAVHPLPRGGFVDDHDDVVATTGVYIVCTRTDEVLYTGSACRPRDPRGLIKRMREHLKKEERRMRWLRAWLVPMRSDTPREQVRIVEGMIGRDLGCPANQRLPRILKPTVRQ
jgi:hypothetical protein